MRTRPSRISPGNCSQAANRKHGPKERSVRSFSFFSFDRDGWRRRSSTGRDDRNRQAGRSSADLPVSGSGSGVRTSGSPSNATTSVRSLRAFRRMKRTANPFSTESARDTACAIATAPTTVAIRNRVNWWHAAPGEVLKGGNPPRGSEPLATVARPPGETGIRQDCHAPDSPIPIEATTVEWRACVTLPFLIPRPESTNYERNPQSSLAHG